MIDPHLLHVIMQNFSVQAIVTEGTQHNETFLIPIYPVAFIKNLNYDFIIVLVESIDDYREKMYTLQKMNVSTRNVAYLGSESVVAFIRGHFADFSLNSGERQTGAKLSAIRYDHVVRYELAAEFLKASPEFSARSAQFGLDCFCGVGYGSFLLTQRLENLVMMGIDASSEAINLAEVSYGNQRNFFVNKFYPFKLPKECFDFAVSFESVEHVKDGYGLLDTIISSIKVGGYLFFSVPNANVVSLSLNPNHFHYRHYTFEELKNFFSNRVRIEEWCGQNVYKMQEGKTILSDLLKNEEMIPIAGEEGQNLIFICKKTR